MAPIPAPAKRDSTAAKASPAAAIASAAPLPSTTRVIKPRRRHEAAAAELQGRIEYRERHAASAALCKLCASKDAAAPDLAAVRALVAGVGQATADILFVDAHGFTSLIRAAQRGRGAIVAVLLAADASAEHVRGATNRGSTGLSEQGLRAAIVTLKEEFVKAEELLGDLRLVQVGRLDALVRLCVGLQRRLHRVHVLLPRHLSVHSL